MAYIINVIPILYYFPKEGVFLLHFSVLDWWHLEKLCHQKCGTTCTNCSMCSHHCWLPPKVCMSNSGKTSHSKQLWRFLRELDRRTQKPKVLTKLLVPCHLKRGGLRETESWEGTKNPKKKKRHKIYPRWKDKKRKKDKILKSYLTSHRSDTKHQNALLRAYTWFLYD